MTAYEELKAWCEKHLLPREYKVVPETESYRATIYFDQGGDRVYISFRDGLYIGTGKTDTASMHEHIDEYERENT